MTETFLDGRVVLHHGDALEVLRELPDASVDAVCTDPPYGLEFMGREWDSFKATGQSRLFASPERDSGRTQTTASGHMFDNAKALPRFPAAGLPFQQWCQLWATECLRVLKPGGYLISAGGSRTFHRMTSGVEDAGFEIRDTITWHFGSGFPKSRNVTADLRSLPSCTCDVPSKLGAVDAGLPASLVRAGVGAEAGAVPLAGGATDLATGVGPEVVAAGSAGDGLADVDAGNVDVDGQGVPVVLGATAMTADAEGGQVPKVVSRIEVEPEALRDEVVSDQAVDTPTVNARPVPGDDRGRDSGPASPLVLPLSAAPRGVSLANESGPVSDSHAGPSAVDAAVGPVAELDATDGAGVDAVSGASHAPDSTAERAFRCQECGGVAGKTPEGMGTALKPATEFFVVARKPLAGTVSANVLTHGTGALNVDGCRVEGTVQAGAGGWQPPTERVGDRYKLGTGRQYREGRWPANVVLDESQAEALDEQSGELTSGGLARGAMNSGRAGGIADGGANPREGTDTMRGHTDMGGASRFFYVAKADSGERVRVNGTAHPTVKPLALMRWLVRLVTPPGGTVLEPFAGSGTTVEACILEGFDCIAIEREADYLPLIRQRINRRRDPVEAIKATGDDGGLFDLLTTEETA